MRACKDIDFLDSYWSEAKRIAADIKENMPVGCRNEIQPVFSNGGAKMYIVNFSDLTDSWSPYDIINRVGGRSRKLEALSDKICNMIYKGDACNVKPLVEAICNNRIKKLTGKYTNSGGEFLGYGHFRWNRQAYTLNPMEIRHLKNYFKI